MNRHPGGLEHTKQMISLSGLLPPAKILDMGAGLGESVALLRSLGYDALGIDLNIEPRRDFVLKGDFLSSSFTPESFDGILSQCAFYVSGQSLHAFKTAYALLRPGGILMISDAQTNIIIRKMGQIIMVLTEIIIMEIMGMEIMAMDRKNQVDKIRLCLLCLH